MARSTDDSPLGESPTLHLSPERGNRLRGHFVTHSSCLSGASVCLPACRSQAWIRWRSKKKSTVLEANENSTSAFRLEVLWNSFLVAVVADSGIIADHLSLEME